MNKAMVAIGIIIMALLGVFAINMITSQQTGQELDYYLYILVEEELLPLDGD